MTDMPELTPEEQAHQKSLETLLNAMRKTSHDPETSIAAREVLQPKIGELEDQLDDVEAGVFSRDTVDLEAAEELLAPALKLLQTLKTERAQVATGIKDFATIANYVEQAISTAESLLG